MNIQLKKGLLEFCVLKVISIEVSYGYKIIDDVSKYVEISESTLYPILKRLEVNELVITYKEEHNGRLRKYYKITKLGKERLREFKEEYKKIDRMANFILEGDKNEK